MTARKPTSTLAPSGGRAPSPTPPPLDMSLRRALAAVLERAFNQGRIGQSKADLGERLARRGRSSRSSSTYVSTLLRGEVFPDRHLRTIAEFLGTDLAGLLRELALEVDRLDSERRDPARIK